LIGWENDHDNIKPDFIDKINEFVQSETFCANDLDILTFVSDGNNPNLEIFEDGTLAPFVYPVLWVNFGENIKIPFEKGDTGSFSYIYQFGNVKDLKKYHPLHDPVTCGYFLDNDEFKDVISFELILNIEITLPEIKVQIKSVSNSHIRKINHLVKNVNSVYHHSSENNSKHIFAPNRLTYDYAGTTEKNSVTNFKIPKEDVVIPIGFEKSMAVIPFWDPCIGGNSSDVSTIIKPRGYSIKKFEYSENVFKYERILHDEEQRISDESENDKKQEILEKLDLWLNQQDIDNIWKDPKASSLLEWGRKTFKYLRMIEMIDDPSKEVVNDSLGKIWEVVKMVMGPGLPYQYGLIVDGGANSDLKVINETTDFREVVSAWNKLGYDRGEDVPLNTRSLWGGFTSKQSRNLDVWGIVRNEDPENSAELEVTRLKDFVSNTPLVNDDAVMHYSKPKNSLNDLKFAFTSDGGFSEMYADHHRHYGYILYAIYVISKYGNSNLVSEVKHFTLFESERDQNIVRTSEPFPLVQIILDILGPTNGVILPSSSFEDKVSRAFPPARNFDPFEGVSRGSGISNVHQCFVGEAILCYRSVWNLMKVCPVISNCI